MSNHNLQASLSEGAKAEQIGENHWRLHIPGGPVGEYRLAQLDDYAGLKRGEFPRQAPFTLSLRARACERDLPGTWGFGLWNDPFSLSLGLGGGLRRFPVLPNAAWFFFASQPNYLSFRDDLPANGQLAGVFRAPHLPTALLAPAGLGLPLLALRPVARLARRVLRKIIQEDASALTHDPTEWHDYSVIWHTDRVEFSIDDQLMLTTPCSPRAPLGIVIWIDNQYAALPPDGRLAYGALANQPAWLEIKDLHIQP